MRAFEEQWMKAMPIDFPNNYEYAIFEKKTVYKYVYFMYKWEYFQQYLIKMSFKMPINMRKNAMKDCI